MEAKVNHHNGVYTVVLKGKMDFESADALKIQCNRHFIQQNVIFDLNELDFVGSSGITPFLEMLATLLRHQGTSLKVCAAGVEFIRVFEAGGLNGLEVYEDEKQARMAFEYHLKQIREQAIQQEVAQSTVPTEHTVETALDRVADIGIKDTDF